MIRLFLFVLALGLVALGLLTIVKAPDWVDWRAAVLAGEYGHWVALGALALAAATWLAWRSRGGNGPAVFVPLLAAAFLIRPCFEAWVISWSLPQTLAEQFGSHAPDRPPFSFAALASPDGPGAPFATYDYTPGLKLDFYRAVGRSPAPAVIVVHGGGWDNGERGQIPQFNSWLANRGYAVADISYGLAPQHVWPSQRENVRAAVDYLRAHASDLGVDPDRLVLFGRSAGGQVAEATAFTVSLPGVRGLAAFYAPADMNFAYQFGREDDILKSLQLLRQFLGGPPSVAQANYDSASAILWVNPRTLPTLLVHGKLDTLVWYKQSERLEAKLAQAQVKHVFLSLPWATHAVEYNLSGPSGQLSTYALEWFLASVTQ